MSDTNLNTFNTPSGAPSSTPQKAPDLEGQVREGLAIADAIEVTSTQATGGQGDDKAAAAAQEKDDSTPVGQATATAYGDVKDIPEDTLLRLTRKKIMNRLAALDLQAEKLVRNTSSKSRAFDMTQVVSEMRRLHVSLQSMYRMAVDRVREMYAQMR